MMAELTEVTRRNFMPRAVAWALGKSMSEKHRWLHTEMQNELIARKNQLLAEKKMLEGSQARILIIDEAVELIDAELSSRAQALAALPQEVADAKPAA